MQFRAKTRPNIIDVASFFLLKEEMTHKKLQLLCYYAEAWSEAILDAPICENNEFQAWVHGPTNVDLWNDMTPYGWNITEIPAMEKQEENKDKFDADQLDILSQVWDVYGSYSANELEGITHQEKPWQEQREGLTIFENCWKQISVQTMKDFYRGYMNSSD